MLFRGGRLDAEFVLVVADADGDGDGVAIFFDSLSSECSDMVFQVALDEIGVNLYIHAAGETAMVDLLQMGIVLLSNECSSLISRVGSRFA